MPATAEPAIEARLAERGYGHRPSRFPGKREVFVLATGEIVGQLDAHDAVERLLRDAT